MINIGVYGATGYAGYELIRLLDRHAAANLVFAASASHAGESLRGLYPRAPELELLHPDDAPIRDLDLAFLCLPHTASAPLARHVLGEGARVIDLSADFRLRDAETYEAWYAAAHPAPELLPRAVYGLTEVNRQAVSSAPLVANPGCYPTSVLLALYPLVSENSFQGPVMIDAKSGVSGAGRTPSATTHFVEVDENLSPYKIGRAHRHIPEMEQTLESWVGGPVEIVFAPHLVPLSRGLLSTIYLRLPGEQGEAELRQRFGELFSGEPFVKLLPPGEAATLAHVVRTNDCAIGLAMAGDTVILTSAIDNLLKGASGQAIQNMNVMFGIDETMGLS